MGPSRLSMALGKFKSTGGQKANGRQNTPGIVRRDALLLASLLYFISVLFLILVGIMTIVKGGRRLTFAGGDRKHQGQTSPAIELLPQDQPREHFTFHLCQ